MNKNAIVLGLFMALLVCPLPGFSHGEFHEKDPYVVIFNKNIRQLPDAAYQAELKNQPAWQEFAKRNGDWRVRFNEYCQLPLKAYGKPIGGLLSASPKAIADDFLVRELAEFNLPYAEIVFKSQSENAKYHYVNYRQVHKGLDILWADFQVKITREGKVMLFDIDAHRNIVMNTAPALSKNDAAAQAIKNIVLNGITTSVGDDLKILPVPAARKYDYRLVYEVTLEATDDQNLPRKYYTLVDAHTGEVWYRSSLIDHMAANIDVNLSATLYPTHPYNPSSVEPLKHQRVVVGSVTHFTDDTGYLGLTNTSPVSATISLSGRWANVRTNNSTPTWTTTLNPGVNNINFDPHANIKELSAYHAVQEIHDYYKSVATGTAAETAMDFVMTTNIDEAGTCNAFYNGSSINFFVAGNGCNATSLVADVVYHEYGHGINYDAYSAFGGNFGNGALGEGYADVWANGITEDPILGIGFFQNNPTGYVRRYDINKKVYPKDLVGEVHADGEIIAGCWWDLGVNLNDHQARQELFFMGYNAILSQPSGFEGLLFWEVLIEALTDDDNDGNLANGTPNYCAITSAFAAHGILESGDIADITHTDIMSTPEFTPITINAALFSLLPNTTIGGYYKVDGLGSWTPFSLSYISGLNFSGTIPGQPSGSIVHYYMDIIDTCGTHLATSPARADDPVNPNIPYYALVNYNVLQYQDLETNTSSWTVGLPTDPATTGMWEIADPLPSFLDPGNPASMVQTGDDHTPAPGFKCAVTENASSTSAGAGSNDIDGGETTLISESYDLSSYTNPVFTYWRWYSNDQGATPGTDFWQVAISDDGGNTWHDVENTNVSDHSWRRFAFKALDYINPTATVFLRFIAEDANQGSLVEAALDDVRLWDEIPLGINNPGNIASLAYYPNPVTDLLHISWNQLAEDKLTIDLTDAAGRIVYSHQDDQSAAGNRKLSIPVSQLASGIYLIKVSGSRSAAVRKVNIIR